jgi:hypothetical protein
MPEVFVKFLWMVREQQLMKLAKEAYWHFPRN